VVAHHSRVPDLGSAETGQLARWVADRGADVLDVHSGLEPSLQLGVEPQAAVSGDGLLHGAVQELDEKLEV
jgi:hypothetical protein